MEKSEKIRHGELSEAVKLLAYEYSMQCNPLLLLFLQNMVERYCKLADEVVELRRDKVNLSCRVGRLCRTIEKLRVQHEV